MKKFTLLLSLLIAIVSIQAQDYLISFAGTGASTTIGTVTVENLTQGTSISLSGSEVLHLSGTWNGINTISNSENVLRIYPNPSTENSTIGFVATASGITNVELFDITGKRLGAVQNMLTIGTHSYQVSGVRSGIYTVRVSSQAYTYTGKLVSNGAPNSAVKISYLGNGAIPFTAKLLKSANAEKLMQYNTGDRLKFIGNTGNYSTIITDIPTQSKTITFPFIACTDGDGNNYTVVQIGSQLWMVENLKTNKYNDGTAIPLVTDNTVWTNLSTPAYCWYNNDATTYKNTYGALYDWYAVNTGKLAPTGWHVPTDAEWTTLENYLIANGYNYDGATTGNKIAKSLAATTDWDSYTDTGIIGNDLTKNNSSGFSALPGGGRGGENYVMFFEVGIYGYWWSSTEGDATNAWYRALGYDIDGLYGDGEGTKSYGLSVRCVRDFTANNYTITTSSNPPAGGTTDGGGAYSAGTSVTVTASKNTGYNFVNWTDKLNGTEVSTNSNYQFIMPANNRTLVANFTAIAATYTLTVTANHGSVTKNPNPDPVTSKYNSGTSVLLTATPDPGYTFVNWTGDATGSLNPLSVTMNANKNITANFTQQDTFTLILIAVNGSVLKAPAQATYNSGSMVQLTATPNTGYTFTGWSGDATGSVNPLTVTMNSDKNITANFTQQFAIFLSSNPLLGGTTSGGGSYNSGTSVTVTATANTGYTFTNWSENGVVVSTTASFVFVLTANRTLVANFAINAYALNITAPNGTYTKTPDQATYNHGTVVKLTATANNDYHFVNWTKKEDGSVISTVPNFSVTMTETRNLVANYR